MRLNGSAIRFRLLLFLSVLLRGTGAIAEEPHKPPLLFLHGFCCNPEMWEHQRNAFSQEYDCWFPTLPHHGPDAIVSVSPTLESTADALLSAITSRWDRKPVVIGHSLGGMIALELAVRAPDAIRGVVLIDAVPSLELNKQLRLSMHGAATPESIRVETRRLMQAGKEAMGVEVYEPYWKSLKTWDVRQKLSAIRVPVFGIYGGRGLYQSTEGLRLFTDLGFDSVPSASIQVVDGAGHFVHLEESEEVNRLLMEFLHGFTH